MAVYFNEIDPVAAHVLECLIKDRVIADGIVDTRSIADVDPKDLAGFRQAHFFAGGGLWSVAARMAGWADDAPLWTGSCPCQPFSVAGKGLGEDDPRHLWPHFFRLIRAVRPPVVVGEQVAGAAGYRWFDGVASDLEGEGYASRAVDIPACSIDAPHIRQRLYWCAVEYADRARQQYGGQMHSGRGVDCAWAADHRATGVAGRINLANANVTGLEGRRPAAECPDQQSVGPNGVADAQCAERWQEPQRRRDVNDRANAGWEEAPSGREFHCAANDGDMADTDGAEPGCRQLGFQPLDGGHRGDASEQERASFWSDYEWRTGADGKARRVKPGVRLLAHGIPGRVGQLRIAGNAIVPQVAAQVLKALMETHEIPR